MADHELTRTRRRLSPARCSAPCICVARAGITVHVNRRRRAHSARWPRRCPSGPRLNCAGLVAYGLSAKLLAETLPIGRPLYASAVRLPTQATGERLESELGPEQSMFADGCQYGWDELPRPDLPLTVGLDGGYVHSSQQRSRAINPYSPNATV